MYESKAISPELSDLFQTIERQSQEYSEAFQLILRKSQEFETNIHALEKFRSYFSNEFTNLAAETKVSINKSLNELDETLEKVLNLHNQYEQIVAYKESLILLHNQLRILVNSAEGSLQEFKKKSDVELGSTLNSIKFRVDKEIEGLSHKYEAKIDFKMKRLETQLINYDQKIIGVIDYQNREFKSVKDDVDSIRGKVHTLFKEKDPDFIQKKDNRSSQIAQLQETFEEKLDSVRKQLKQVNDLANDTKDQDKENTKIYTELDTLKDNAYELNQLLKISQKRQSSLLTLTISATILAVIAVVVAILK